MINHPCLQAVHFIVLTLYAWIICKIKLKWASNVMKMNNLQTGTIHHIHASGTDLVSASGG